MSDDSHEYDEDALEFIEGERARIAALHATCPKQIWLQVDPEAEQFDGWDAQTWCSDKINETDVRYVLAAIRDAEVAELKKEVEEDSALRERLAKILAEVAIALKGQEGALSRHSWHDLAQCAIDVVKERDQLSEQVKMLRDVLQFYMDNGICEPLYHKAKEALAATEPKSETPTTGETA